MRISDWSSDVVLFRSRRGGALPPRHRHAGGAAPALVARCAGPAVLRHGAPARRGGPAGRLVPAGDERPRDAAGPADRKSVGSGKSVSVRVDLGGRRIITKKNTDRKSKQ